LELELDYSTFAVSTINALLGLAGIIRSLHYSEAPSRDHQITQVITKISRLLLGDGVWGQTGAELVSKVYWIGLGMASVRPTVMCNTSDHPS